MHTYTVRSGDSLSRIAQRESVDLQSLLAANPQIKDPNRIYPGQVLQVPDHRDDSRPPASPSAPPPPASGVGPEEPSSQPASTYTVARGDSMSRIASRHGISLQALLAANPAITNPNRIYPGQQLVIPGAGPTAPSAPPSTPPPTQPSVSSYTVVSGDSMSRIASRHGLTLQALLAANPQVTNPNRIFVGQTLRIPGASAPTTPPPPSIGPNTNIDALINSIASSLGIETATARAVLAVESSGNGFINGRLTIRFESHIFARYDSRGVAADHGRGQTGEWAAFEKALSINREAAFKSISMGAAQIMGFNAARVGYPSAEAMFNAFANTSSGEAAQIKGMFDFISTNSTLLAAARTKNWATFARYYNGAGYANHNPPYDERLRRAYQAALAAA